ncbi:MAG: hypothetical protein IPG92_01455 [Flavobacteriales bacterium]|nr:hypothetical protein [Flavobacteriales bacterium]
MNNGVKLAVKVLLDGPYDSNTQLMRDDLRVAGLIPNAEPYTTLGFTQASDGGGEVRQSGITTNTGNDAVVDWVLVELRNAGTPTQIAATRAALVQRDGDVVAEDGVTPIALLAPAGSYHVAVRHRNHFGAMTASAINLSTTTTILDFTASSTLTYGTEGRKTVGSKQLLWAGNVFRDGFIRYTGADNDRDPILVAIGGTVPTNSTAGYAMQDVNLDGIVRYVGALNDRDPILVNIGGNVPTAIRSQQLP